MPGIDRSIEIANSANDDNLIQRAANRIIVSGLIHEVMENKGISQAELASRMNVCKSHISRLLSGDRNLTLDTISDMMIALKMKMQYRIIEREENGLFYQSSCESIYSSYTWIIKAEKRERPTSFFSDFKADGINSIPLPECQTVPLSRGA